MKLTRIEDAGGYEGEKRQHIPYVLEFTCDKCGYENELNFWDHYLSYPNLIGDNCFNFECQNWENGCENLIIVKISIDIKAELINDS